LSRAHYREFFVSQVQEQATELFRLADIASRVKDRGRNDIYLAMITLVEHQMAGFSERERSLAADILRHLAKDVEMSIRIKLAERIADKAEAPHELILMLADDRIEVARLVLARSPVLSEADLLNVIKAGSDDHQVAVAERPEISEIVSSSLARSECESVLIALLRNQTAKIGSDTFSQLADRARLIAALQEPLVNRADLPPVLADRMYAWVSVALKTVLVRRYPEVEDSLTRALDETTSQLQTGKPPTPEASAAKLVNKLAGSGQIKPSFLIRVLHQGQMDLFEHGFAALLDMDVADIRTALYGQKPTLVALACRAVGIDRSVFMTVFNLSRHNRKVSTSIPVDDLNEIRRIFEELPKPDAMSRLRLATAA